jgi:D-alanyl-D-alanine carboxypeptidase
MNTRELASWAMLTAAMLGLVIFAVQQLVPQGSHIAAADVSGAVSQNTTTTPLVPEKNSATPDLQLTATSALSLETNFVDPEITLYSKNAAQNLPIASITKLVTAMVVLDHYDMGDLVTIDPQAAAMDTVADDVKLGDTMSVQNAFQLMLVISSNKIAYALAEKTGEASFVAEMNQKVRQIGLKDTFFAEPTGLSAQNYSTANDLATLAVYVVENYPEIVETSQMQSITIPNWGTATSTDEMLGETTGVVLGKTGFTDDAKQCLLLVVWHPESKSYLVNVLLGSDDRFDEMHNMLSWVTSAYTWKQ